MCLLISWLNEKKKRNIDNDLAIWPSHNTTPLLRFLVPRILQFIVGVDYIAYFIFVFFCAFPNFWFFLLNFFFSSQIVSKVLPLACSPFHCLQFLSNLPQYSLLYCLSNYLNSFFAINHPGSSPLLNVPFSLSCYLTSSISHQYSFSNSSTAPFVFSKFSILSQVSDSAINPFYHTRYLFFPLICCLFNIFSTFHSSSLSIITGASCSFLSQMATYWFVSWWFDNQKAQKSKV